MVCSIADGVWCAWVVQSVRQKLYDELVKVNTDRDWSFILRQIGMFSFTGLTNAQVRIGVCIMGRGVLVGMR